MKIGLRRRPQTSLRRRVALCCVGLAIAALIGWVALRQPFLVIRVICAIGVVLHLVLAAAYFLGYEMDTEANPEDVPADSVLRMSALLFLLIMLFWTAFLLSALFWF